MRTLTGPATAGLPPRVAGTCATPAAVLPRPRPAEADEDVFAEPPGGPLVLPGKYKRVAGEARRGRDDAAGRPGRVRRRRGRGRRDGRGATARSCATSSAKVAQLAAGGVGALEAANELTGRLEQACAAPRRGAGGGRQAGGEDRGARLGATHRDVLRALRGDVALRGRNENTPTSISERVEYVVDATRYAAGEADGDAARGVPDRERPSSPRSWRSCEQLVKDGAAGAGQGAGSGRGAVDAGAAAGVEGGVKTGNGSTRSR